MVELPFYDNGWVLARRGERNRLKSDRPYAQLVEPERQPNGNIEDVATVFLTNKECPYRCLMCDLWKNTLPSKVSVGNIPGQIRWALQQMPSCPHIKLYNAGSFFDAQAIPRADWKPIAELVKDYRTVIVESHPRLVRPGATQFAAMLPGRLQVAMGLETVDPAVLPRLNKQMSLEDFERAVQYLIEHQITVRAFVLVRTPFQSESEGVWWAKRSLDWAFERGVECCVLIPTRAGNGAMDELQRLGQFSPPSISSLEEVFEYGLSLRAGRVFVDLWDLNQQAVNEPSLVARVARLRHMNLFQTKQEKYQVAEYRGTS